MALSQFLLWFAITSLYLGFSAGLGVLIHRIRNGFGSHVERRMAILYTLLIFLPSSILVVERADTHFVLRLMVLIGGLGLVWLGASQPSWIPEQLWGRTFGRRYLAATMGFATAWTVNLALTTQALPALILATSAGLAGAASLFTAKLGIPGD